MIPTITPVPVRGFKSDSGLANVQDALTMAPGAVVERHRRACLYMILSSVILLLAILFFAAGCNHAYAADTFTDPAPLDYGIYPAAVQPNVYRVPAAPITNAVPTPEPSATLYGVAGLVVLGVWVWIASLVKR